MQDEPAIGSDRRATCRWRGARSAGPRRLAMTIALACLAIGSVQVSVITARGASRPATSAVLLGLRSRYYLDVDKHRTTLCVGETTTYAANVYRTPIAGPLTPTPVDMVQVAANSFDTNVGTFLGKDRYDILFISTTGPGPGDRPMAAQFRFKAGTKPGRTTLLFRADVPVPTNESPVAAYVELKVDIRVIDCKFKVSGVVFFPPADLNPPFVDPPLEGTLRPTQLTADQDGHLSAKAIIHWGNGKSIIKLPPDVITSTSKFGADQEVIVNGDVSDEGLLTLTFELPRANGTITWTDIQGLTIPNQVTAYIVNNVTVHISTEGGTVRVPATYKPFDTVGTATIVVTKVKS